MPNLVKRTDRTSNSVPSVPTQRVRNGAPMESRKSVWAACKQLVLHQTWRGPLRGQSLAARQGRPAVDMRASPERLVQAGLLDHPPHAGHLGPSSKLTRVSRLPLRSCPWKKVTRHSHSATLLVRQGPQWFVLTSPIPSLMPQACSSVNTN